MDEIRESRILTISNKVFSLKNVRDMASIVWKTYQSAHNKSQHASVSFSANASDDSSFESNSVTIYDEASTISSKRITSIDITYHNYTNDAYVNVQISQGDSAYNRSRITVRGHDSLWVNGALSELKNVLDSVPPQNLLLRKYSWAVHVLVSLGIGLIMLELLLWIVPTTLSTTPSLSLDPAWAILLTQLSAQFLFFKYLFRYFVAFWLGSFPYMLLLWSPISNSLSSTWPSIEIQIGPEHTFVERRRRQMLLTVLSLNNPAQVV